MAHKQKLERILSIICSVFDAYSAVVFLARDEGLRIAAWHSLGDKITPGAGALPGKGLVGWLAANQQPLLINNFDQRKNKLGYYVGDEEKTVKAFMGRPLPRGRGVICLDSKRTYSFSDKDQKILQLFSELVADHVDENLQMAETLSQCRYYRSLRLLTEMGGKYMRWSVFLQQFLELISETTRLNHAFLAVRDEWGEKYAIEGYNEKILTNRHHDERFDLGSGMVGWVFKNDAPLYAEEPERGGLLSPLFGKRIQTPGFRCGLCLPVQVNKMTMAVLGMASTEAVTFDAALKEYVETVAAHFSLFLENLFLHNKLREALANSREMPDKR